MIRWLALSALSGAALTYTALPDTAALGAAFLIAGSLFLGLSLGALGLVQVHLLTGGSWGLAIRPCLAALIRALPAALFLLLPVLPLLPELYPWARPDPDLPEQVARVSGYLNPAFFIARFAICATLWLVIGWRSLVWCRDGTGTLGPGLAAAALVLSVSVWDVDWIMSLEPGLAFSIHPMNLIVSQMLGALALSALWLWHRREPLADVANLMLGFLILAVYLGYMQWLVVWAGDLPAEIGWYLDRAAGMWLVLLWAIILCWGAAGIGLAIGRLKHGRRGFGLLSALVLAGCLFLHCWTIHPPLSDPRLSLIGAFLLGGAVWGVAALAPVTRRRHA
jgi:hypothetical protein